MDTNKIYKILASLALISAFIVFFVLFGKIQNLLLEYKISDKQSINILLILVVILTVFLFTLSILASSKHSNQDKYSNNEIDIFKEKSKQQVVDKDENEEELLNVENYIKKILPKVDSKLKLEKYTEKILSNIAKEFDIVQGLFFVKDREKDIYHITGKYAYFGDEEPKSFNLGETLSGQVAINKIALNLKDIPDNYVTILSGLGSSSPNHLIIIPIIIEDKTIAIIELASFKEFKRNFSDLFEGMSNQIGETLLKY
ncbi:MAG: GAF domain-containing protein [Bacteroidales bacterium]|nr:GAF domain-containing protein [Bacteroidales bacterium]